MEQAGIRSLRAYLLKMAVDGMVVNLDLADVRECSQLLRNVSNNVNQIARRVNEGGNIYAADIADVQARLDGIQDKIIINIGSLDTVKIFMIPTPRTFYCIRRRKSILIPLD